MLRRQHSMALLLWVFCIVVVCGGALARSEADWLYEAARFMERFETTGSADLPPDEVRRAYLTLLDDLSEFGKAQAGPAREQRGRRLFGLLMSARINEQIGDVAAARRAREAYSREMATLPQQEKALLVQLFERAEGKTAVHVPRLCEVEARGKEVRVRAVDYPLEGLLEKMAEATGEKIELVRPDGPLLKRMEEAMGEKIDSPPLPSGLVDYVHEDWRRVDNSVARLMGRLGLYSARKPGERVQVGIFDPLYLASVGERARRLPAEVNPTWPERGIEAGYLIFKGHYVRPPYKVEVRTVDERAVVYVNGLAVGKGYKLKDVVEPPPAPVSLPEDGQFTKASSLMRYAEQQYRKDLRELSEDEARERLAAFLKGQDIVKSFRITVPPGFRVKFEKQGLYFADTSPRTGSSNSPRGRKENTGPETERFRKRALAKAANLKTGIEGALAGNGLVLISTKGGAVWYEGKEAREKLLAICTAVQEAVRHKEQLSVALFPLITLRESDWAWEILLNLRHRELWQRMQQDATQ